jgi:hypothetical protein
MERTNGRLPRSSRKVLALTAALLLNVPLALAAGTSAAPQNGTAAGQTPTAPIAPQPTPPQPRISATQAQKLFSSVDTILHFDSSDTGLPIHNDVKRRLITRAQVIAFLTQQMDEDKDTARIERSAIVLEKFGLLPAHFALRDFLLKLLGEQVAGFYDSKTKTVNLLDWIDADTQKPVLAHELTHALQDQYQSARGIDLDKWENAGPDGTAKNVTEDRDHIRYDETSTAREAVLEGQAMAAYFDWGLEGRGQSLRTLPEIPLSQMTDATGKESDSPILDSAPLVLRESLLFPYEDGLVFEQKVLKDRGTNAAFAGVLQRPPDSSWEVMNPLAYEHKLHPPVLAMPDLHPLLDPDWTPYDVGVMGALDVRIMGAALADAGAGADAALAWDGGVYYAAQARSAKTPAERDQTGSIALVYLSRWKTARAAQAFATLYRRSLAKRYPGSPPAPGTATRSPGAATRSIDLTAEGPVIVDQQDRSVFISHTLPLALSGKVEAIMLAAQTGSQPASATASTPQHELAAPLVQALTADATVLTIRTRPTATAPVY